MLTSLFTLSLLHATVRSATPILFAAMAASLTQQANILNIGVEGIMLMCSFVAIVISYHLESWPLALVSSAALGAVAAWAMGYFHLEKKVDVFVLGMLLNLFALALTKFLMPILLGVGGIFSHPDLTALPKIHLPLLAAVPALDTLFNNYDLLELFAPVLVISLAFILYRTRWGLRLQSVGFHPDAAETAGISVRKVRYQAILYSGVIAGVGGAYLSLGYSTLFVENMTNGRGFMGVAAMFFGAANPIKTWVATLIFGFSDSIGARLQSLGLPSAFVLMMPYVTTVATLAIAAAVRMRRHKKNQPHQRSVYA